LSPLANLPYLFAAYSLFRPDLQEIAVSSASSNDSPSIEAEALFILVSSTGATETSD